MKRIILYLIVIIAGLVSGFFSRPLYGFIWQDGRDSVAVMQKSPASPQGSAAGDVSERYISEGEAITAAKQFPPVKAKIRTDFGGTQLKFEIEQEPSGEYPIWLVEVTERFPDKIPVTGYVQVDAVSGRVLDLQFNDMKVAEIGLAAERRDVLKKLGKPQKSRKVYDKTRRQTLRVDTFPGIEIVCTEQGAVVKVTADLHEFAGPRGIKAGDPKSEVIRTFGKAATALTDLLEYRPVDNNNAWMVIKLDSGEKTVELSLERAL